jgi:NTP pyrophosphatase (non-canonical NTP hydrolase)
VNWRQITAERKEWVDKNFPPDVYSHSVLGVIEEVGELTHHYLKDLQSIRGDHDEHVAEMKDAIGDITVYLLGIMYHKDIYPMRSSPYQPQYEPVGNEEDILFRLASRTGRLAMGVELGFQVAGIPYLLTCLCAWFGWDYEQIVEETWDHVKQRDWTKNKQDGDASAPDPEYDREEEQMLDEPEPVTHVLPEDQ